MFVGLNSADMSVERVAERVARGGHDIPEHVVRRRYETSVGRLPQAMRLSHGSMLFDNSLASEPRLLLQVKAAEIEVNKFDAADAFHRRLAERVSDALLIPVGEMLRNADPVSG